MTYRAIVGLLALNVLYLAVGSCLLWALRGWGSAREWGSLTGLAYLVGVSSLGIAWVLLLVLGVPFGGATICVSAVAVALVGVAVAHLRNRRISFARSSALSNEALCSSRRRVWLRRSPLRGAVPGGRLAGPLRVRRLGLLDPEGQGDLRGSGELDERFFTELPGSSYSPLVPALDAAAFHAMGSADVVTLHLQYWLFAVGFTFAVAGLLATRIPGWILWPFLLLLSSLRGLRSPCWSRRPTSSSSSSSASP